jgi:hypothetical protein
MKVYLLWHTRDRAHATGDAPDEDAKLLGAYSSRRQAEARIVRARTLHGFCDSPDGFHVDEYSVDRDEWAEGFVTVLSQA